MDTLNNLTITSLEPPFVVHSKRGRKFYMTNRAYWGLSLCISGQITYTMDEKNYVSIPGFAVLLPQGSSYSLSGDKEGLFPVINFRCQYLSCKEILVIPLRNPKVCIQLFEEVKKRFFEGSRLKAFSALYQLLSEISETPSVENSLLLPITQYIDEHISDPTLSNQRLANLINISEVYLRKLFHMHYKTTPKQYILQKRIQHSKQLLISTHMSVTEISETCGFSSLYHFCRAFKQQTGLTPTQYAAQNSIYTL